MRAGRIKPENIHGWLVWIIVLLALMNAATIITIIYNRSRSEKEKSVIAPGQIQFSPASARYGGGYFRDELGLNEEQMEKFAEINPLFREQIRNINNNLNLLRQRMFKEMSSVNPDPARLDQYSDSIGILHSDLKKVTYRYFLGLSNICDAQQRNKLDKMFGEMFISERGMGQYGRGGQTGRYRGRPFNY